MDEIEAALSRIQVGAQAELEKRQRDSNSPEVRFADLAPALLIYDLDKANYDEQLIPQSVIDSVGRRRFAAASEREGEGGPEATEPAIALRPMSLGREVVEDYGYTGLSLRPHPVAFLRDRLTQRRIVTCAEAMASRDRRWCEVAGLVLVRQRPGSAKGVMFITIEDETGVANLVVWQKVFEAHRRTVLGAGMIAVKGRIQREGEVVHLVAHQLTDLSRDLADVGRRDTAFPLSHGRGDEFRHGTPAPDPRQQAPDGPRPRDMYVRDLHLETITVKRRNFR